MTFSYQIYILHMYTIPNKLNTVEMNNCQCGFELHGFLFCNCENVTLCANVV